jgi:putative Ca2+/H+ antiporter (TMEM165/GDT1 family)
MINLVAGLIFLVFGIYSFWYFYDYLIVFILGIIPLMLLIIGGFLAVSGWIIMKDSKKAKLEEARYENNGSN